METADSKKTLFANDAATVWFYPEKRLVHHIFHKPIFDKDFRAVLNSGYDVFKIKQAEKWLSDDRNNSALPPEDCAWSQDIWLPKMLKTEWKQWAIVMPEKLRGAIVMKRLIEHVAGFGLEAKTFSDPNEALAWISL